MQSSTVSFTKLLESKPAAAPGGYTLIEIVIVLIVLGILIGLAAPAINSLRNDSLATKESSLEREIAQAKARYFLANPGANEHNAPDWNQISPYLMSNGIPNPTQAQFLGSGFTLTSIGNLNTAPVVSRP